jgi:hypothetical protein
MLVLVLQVMLDIELGVILQRLGPMEIAGFLMPIDGNLWVSELVNNPHGIPIGLGTVRHEAFQVGFGDSMAAMTWLRLCQKTTRASLSSDWKSQQAMVMTRW